MTSTDPRLIAPPETPPAWQRRRLAVLLLFAGLCLLYATTTPIFEISDEVSHYPVVDYIADTGELPVQDRARTREYDWEAAQPPLYYALAALLVAPFDRDDMESFLVDNPHAKVGIGLATDNHNFVLHDWDAEAFPWAGTPLHVRLVRLFSIVLGLGSIWLIFTVARLALPARPGVALLAMLLAALNPMFIAITASVNNDNLTTLLVTLGLAMTLTLWRQGFTWRRVWALALVGTLASASKLSGSIIFAPAGLAILLVVLRDKRPLWQVGAAALIFFGVWGALFGWWYVRNAELYDDPLGNYHMAQTVGLRAAPIALDDLIIEEGFSFYAAFWGWFGAVNILAPASLFTFTYLLIALSGLGWLRVGWRAWQDRQWWQRAPTAAGNLVPWGLLMLALGLGIVGLIRWTLITPASQGRLLFPFMAAVTLPLAWGLVALLGRWRASVMVTPLAVFALYCGAVLIPHAFRLPERFEALPAEARGVDVIYIHDEPFVELVGYRVDDAPIGPTQQLELRLYWRALARTPTDMSLFAQVFGPGDNDALIEVGKIDSYPGRGLLRTSTWETGTIYEDVYLIDLENWQRRVNFPFQPRIKIGWRDAPADRELPVRSAAGEALDAVLVPGGRVVLDSFGGASDVAAFGGIIDLYGASLSEHPEGVQLAVIWGATQPISEDFTVFVQLIDPARRAEPLAFGDSVPRDGWWPTSAWVPDNNFFDRYVIPVPDDLPPGDYEVIFGFYRPADFTRLPATGAAYPDAEMRPLPWPFPAD